MNIIKSKDYPRPKQKYRIVGKLGSDSLFTVLPKSLAGALGIKQGDLLEIHQESDKIIIQKVEK